MEVKTSIPRMPNPDQLAAAVRETAVRSLRGWSTDRQGIGQRFTPAAYGLYGFLRRAYAHEHPSPFVRSGGFRDRVLAGSGQIQDGQTSEGFRAELTVTAPAELDRREGGIYALEWATLYTPEARDLDHRIETAGDPALQRAIGAADG